MTTASVPLGARTRFDVPRVLRAGATVGVCDFLAAMVVYVWVMRVTTPTRLWQGVARALLGKPAFDGGLATVAFGLAMHFTIAMSWTIGYALLYYNVPALRRLTHTPAGTVLAGALYGTFVHVMMSRVIVPLTLAPTSPKITAMWFVGLAIHMTAVGQPMAWIVRERA